jgi:photosystem II stability/assembly factor-like uncharacterized protein
VSRILLLTGASVILFVCAYHFRSAQKNIVFQGKSEFKFWEEEEYEANEEEHETDEPAKFFEFHKGIRTRDDENAPGYPSGYKWKALDQASQLASARRSKAGRTLSNGVLEWKERGPGNVPGRTRALFNIPNDPALNTWLAGSATGGIWRTENGGTSWSERSTGFPALPISSFAADNAATVIYAGTGEFLSSIYSAIGNGIFKSEDKGLTWTQILSTKNNSDFSIVTRVITHPTNPDIILATTAPGSQSNGTNSFIMRSVNGGASWTKVKTITGIFEQIIATPGNFNIQYASQHGVGVWKSTDAGVTWSLSNTGMSPDGRIEISVSPVNSDKVFASAEGSLSGTNSDLYISANAGSSWDLVDVKFNGATVDFFEGQGFYDNTILCDPFNENKIYVGGVSLFRVTLGSGSSQADNFKLVESGTQSFLALQSFSGVNFDQQRLDVAGPPYAKIDVEIRFGPGVSQKAHRFLVPDNTTSGVAANDYTYQNYTDVPFEVWDVTNNKQLMVSFRDQNRNGKFDLLPQHLTTEGVDYLTNSREYVYINNIAYNSTIPHSSITQAGGHLSSMIFTIYPALADGATWDESGLPGSKLVINYDAVNLLNASTITVADGRGSFDNKNKSDQINLTHGVHSDHHVLIPVTDDPVSKTYKLLLGNDGGVFVSKVSKDPGTTNGDWVSRSFGYNTSQFYGADKKPGSEQYIGGLQDNGTRISSSTEAAGSLSAYSYALGGDGFEVLWNSKRPNYILGSIYSGDIYRSTNGGSSWQKPSSGLSPSDAEFPFVTKLANSKDFPDRVFTVGKTGVYVSQDFGGSWTKKLITQKFVYSSALFLDVEVSRANANIIWAGSGMNATPGNERYLYVSSDGGQTFSPTNNYTSSVLGNITKLASHPAEPNTAYALFSFADSPKIIRTRNLGQTWEDISGFGSGSESTNGFPDVAVYCLYVRPDNPEIIWAGTEIGIVESQDNGESWSLLEDFPHVSVWDMKGQDNEIVIATHGRGIWTATLSEIQTGTDTPQIIATGTSPDKKLAFRVSCPQAFDSMYVYVGTTLMKTIRNVASGDFDIGLDGVTPGTRDIKLVSYRNEIPYQSMVVTANHLSLLDKSDTYATYFAQANDVEKLTVEEMTLQTLPGSSSLRQSLQTDHNYSNDEHQVLIRTPITVSATLPKMFYKDIAIVEPEHDSVIVEATKNGLDWITLKKGYDARLNEQWKAAFDNNQPGSTTMFMEHEVDISPAFSTGDLLLFRMRLVSNKTINAWGWAIDYITIQEQPEIPGTEPFSLFPNPSQGDVSIQYLLTQPSDVVVRIYDIYGRTVAAYAFANRVQGSNSETVSVSALESGNYILVIDSKDKKQTRKLNIKR